MPSIFTRSAPMLRAPAPILALMLLCAASVLHAQENRPNGTRLFVTYRCRPADRPAFIRGLESDGVKRFEEWKRSGVIADYLVIYNQFVDENTWDAMAIITFERYAQTERWRALERDFPGGLDSTLLKLATPATSYLADLVLANGQPGDRSTSIFLIIPYEYHSRGEYLDYIRTYGVPQFDGWIRSKAISNYGIYLNHHPTGKPWDVLLVFEYNGVDGLGRRDEVKTLVREELAKDPGWKLLSDSKRDFRTEYEVVMAKAVQGNR
jgi:hypothetical protein